MDALSDPRAFLSAQEKREQQMKAMGIEASDINTKDLKGGKTSIKPQPSQIVTVNKSGQINAFNEPKGGNLIFFLTICNFSKIWGHPTHTQRRLYTYNAQVI